MQNNVRILTSTLLLILVQAFDRCRLRLHNISSFSVHNVFLTSLVFFRSTVTLVGKKTTFNTRQKYNGGYCPSLTKPRPYRPARAQSSHAAVSAHRPSQDFRASFCPHMEKSRVLFEYIHTSPFLPNGFGSVQRIIVYLVIMPLSGS